MKPYISYKNSGIQLVNDIPASWTVSKLKHICKIYGRIGFRGYTIQDIVEKLQGAITLSPSNIENQSLTLNVCTYISWTKYNESPEIQVAANDILVVKTGSTIGKVAIVNEADAEYPMTINPQLIIIKETLINTRFLYYVMVSSYFQSLFYIYSAGGSTPAISQEKIYNFTLAYPQTMKEQGQIVKFLDRRIAQIDKLINDKQKLIELLNEERTAIINQAVTKGINPNVPMKDSGADSLGEVPAHWNVTKLKYIALINSTANTYSHNKQSNDEVVFLPMEKVLETGRVIQDKKRKISEVSSGFTYFERGDVIVAKITPCFENGKGALLNELKTDFGYGSTEFHTLRATKEITREFLYFVTKSERFMTTGEAFMTGAAGQKRIPTNFLKEFVIGLPKLDEQRRIVKHINTQQQRIDFTRGQIVREIQLLQEYKTSLISEVVTGKIDVRNEVPAELTELTL